MQNFLILYFKDMISYTYIKIKTVCYKLLEVINGVTLQLV